MSFIGADGRPSNLVQDWADAVLSKLMTYTDKQPVISPKMEFVGRFFTERMERDQCGLSGYADYDAQGRLVGVRVASDRTAATGPCTAVVSMPASSVTTGADVVESHGLDTTFRVGMTPGASRTLSMTQGMGEIRPT